MAHRESRHEGIRLSGLVHLERHTMEGSRIIRDNLSRVCEELRPLVQSRNSSSSSGISPHITLPNWIQARSLATSTSTPISSPAVSPRPRDLESFVINLESDERDTAGSSTSRSTGSSHMDNQTVPSSSLPTGSDTSDSLNNSHNEESVTDLFNLSPEASSLVNVVKKYLPFVTIILAKTMYDYSPAILLFVGLCGTFAFYNSRLRAEIAQHSQRNIGFLMFAVTHLIFTICFFYYLYDDMKLYLSIVFIPPYVQPLTVTDLLWLVAVTDFILKLITIIIKILVTLIPNYLFDVKKRCANTRDCKCRASMPLKKELRTYSTFHTSGVPTHESDGQLGDELDLRRRILKRCEEEPTEARQIFDEECARVPLEVASRIGYSEMKSSIERAKKSSMDKIPQSLQEFGDMLTNPNNLKYAESVSGDPFFMGSIEDEEGSVSILFGSLMFLELLNTAEEIHVDGTFKVRPTIPASRQLLTVMSIHMNQAFPVFYVLMERKTLASYRRVLNYIRGKAPNFNPRVIITDFGRSLQSAAVETFPTAKVVGCWYHSANAMRKKAKNLGLTDLLKTNPHARKAVNMTMALPLLPTNDIPAGLEVTKVYADHNGLGDSLQKYFQYVKHTWIEGVGARHFSVFKQARRTNNDQEAYHRNLMRKMRHSHPNIWVFTVHLKGVEHSYRQKYLRLVNGGSTPAKRPCYLAQDRHISDATNKYVEGLYTVLDFLHRTSHSINDVMSTATPAEDDDDGAREDVGPPPHEPGNLEDEVLDIAQEAQPIIRGDGRGRNRGRGRAAGRGRGGRGRGNRVTEQAAVIDQGNGVDDPPAPATARGRGRGLGRGGNSHRGALVQGNNENADPYSN